MYSWTVSDKIIFAFSLTKVIMNAWKTRCIGECTWCVNVRSKIYVSCCDVTLPCLSPYLVSRDKNIQHRKTGEVWKHTLPLCKIFMHLCCYLENISLSDTWGQFKHVLLQMTWGQFKHVLLQMTKMQAAK